MTSAGHGQVQSTADLPMQSLLTPSRITGKAIRATVAIIMIVYASAALALLAVASLPATITVFGRPLSLELVHHVIFRLSFIGLVVVPIIFIVEAMLVGWRQSSIRDLVAVRSTTMRTDTVWYFVSHLKLGHWPQVFMTFGLCLLSGNVLHTLLERGVGIHLYFSWLPAVMQVSVFYLIYTFLDYWAHRIDHTSLMWPLHRYHHSAEEFVVFTAERGHPAGAFTQHFIKVLPMTAIGMSPANIIDITTFVVAMNYFSHSRIPFRLGWLGAWVFQSPTHHRFHHVKHYEGQSWNYSLCPLWDRLFNTWHPAVDSEVVVGVDYAYRHGAWIGPDLWRDYVEFLKGWRRLVVRRWQRAEDAAVATAGEVTEQAKALDSHKTA